MLKHQPMGQSRHSVDYGNGLVRGELRQLSFRNPAEKCVQHMSKRLKQKTVSIMPNKPWLIDRTFSVSKVSQILLWISLRTIHRILNALPVEINMKNRVINHRYFLNSKNWTLENGDHVFGYMGNLIDNHGIKAQSEFIIETRPSDFPIFFDKPIKTTGEFFIHSSNNPYNYFHFLYDFICPLFIHRMKNPEVQIYLPFDITKWQADWLNMIGQTNILHASVNGNFSASKIVGFDKFVDSKNDIRHPGDFMLFRNYVESLSTECSSIEPSTNIYIVRKKSSMGRNIVNQREIISRLAEMNFSIVDLDQMSVAMQLRIFRNAQLIVSPHDAGLSNLIATLGGAKVIELLPTQAVGTYDMYKNICKLTRIDYAKIMPAMHADYKHGSNFDIDSAQIIRDIMVSRDSIEE